MPEEKGTAGGERRAWLLFTPNSEIWIDSGEGRNLCPSRGLAQCAADLLGLSGQQQGVRKWAAGGWSGGATCRLSQRAHPPLLLPHQSGPGQQCCAHEGISLPCPAVSVVLGRCPITVLRDLLIKMAQPLIPDSLRGWGSPDRRPSERRDCSLPSTLGALPGLSTRSRWPSAMAFITGPFVIMSSSPAASQALG